MKIKPGKISSKLHELLVEDIDINNSEINKLLDEIIINVILTSVSKDKRLKYYKLVETNDETKIVNFVKTEIVDFNLKVYNKLHHILNKTL